MNRQGLFLFELGTYNEHTSIKQARHLHSYVVNNYHYKHQIQNRVFANCNSRPMKSFLVNEHLYSCYSYRQDKFV